MKILITGGAGYIGTRLIPMLLESNHEVTVIDSLRYGGDSLLSWFAYKNFHFKKADIRDEAVLSAEIEKCDFIVHLAALVGFPICDKFPIEAKSINWDAVLLIDKLRGKKPLFFASTDSNYGATTEKLVSESVSLAPKSLYGQVKTDAEHLFLKSGNSIVYRFASAFGVSTRMRLDNLVHDFCYQVKMNKSLVLYEPGVRRSFVHVHDMARGIKYAVENFDKMKNNVYNFANPNLVMTKLDLARLIGEHVKFYLHVADYNKDKEQRDFILNVSKLLETGFKFERSLADGLDEVLKAIDAIELKSHYYPM